MLRIACHYSKRVIWAASRWVTMRMHPYLWPRVTVAWLFHLWFWSIYVTSCYCRLAISSMILIHICDLCYCRLAISSMILLFVTSKVCGNHYLVASYLSRILDGVDFCRFVLEFFLTCRCLQSSQVKVRAIYYYYCVFLLLFLDI